MEERKCDQGICGAGANRTTGSAPGQHMIVGQCFAEGESLNVNTGQGCPSCITSREKTSFCPVLAIKHRKFLLRREGDIIKENEWNMEDN